MRAFLFILFFIVHSAIATATSIRIGYLSKDVVIWRFWEADADNIPHAKMLVYNISDSAVTFCLNKSNDAGRPLDEHSRSYLLEQTKRYRDTIIQPEVIKPHEYGIYDIIVLEHYGLSDAVFINGNCIGTMPNLAKPAIQVPPARYYSCEGLMGTVAAIICKNRLFVNPGETDTMQVSFDYTYKPLNEANRKVTIETKGTISNIALCTGKNCDTPDTKNGKIEMVIDVWNKKSFTFQLCYKAAQSHERPVADLREEWPNNAISMLCRLPVLVKYFFN